MAVFFNTDSNLLLFVLYLNEVNMHYMNKEEIIDRTIDEAKLPQCVFLLPPQLAYDRSLELWDTIVSASPKPKAIILETFGSGSLASEFIPKIKEAVGNGIAVFLLSPMHRGHGIEKVTYDIQEDALKAGAVEFVAKPQSMQKHVIKTFAQESFWSALLTKKPASMLITRP